MKIEQLKINYKTLDEFQKFSEYGLAELSMLKDLESNMVENTINSPFYGIYEGPDLVARISLYRNQAKYDRYFSPPQPYYELFKLEVLPHCRNKGLGTALVTYAKSLELPIKTNARRRSDDFWVKQGFVPVDYNPIRDRGESPYVWLPDGIKLSS